MEGNWEILQRVENNTDSILPLLSENDSISESYKEYLNLLHTVGKRNPSIEDAETIINIDRQLMFQLHSMTTDGIGFSEAWEVSAMIQENIDGLSEIIKKYEQAQEQVKEKSIEQRKEVWNPGVFSWKKWSKEGENQNSSNLQSNPTPNTEVLSNRETEKIDKLAAETIDLAHKKIKTWNDTFVWFDDKWNGWRWSYLVEQLWRKWVWDNIMPNINVEDVLNDINMETMINGSKTSLINMIEELQMNSKLDTDAMQIEWGRFVINTEFNSVEEKQEHISTLLQEINNALKSHTTNNWEEFLLDGKVTISPSDFNIETDGWLNELFWLEEKLTKEIDFDFLNFSSLFLKHILWIDTEKKVAGDWSPEDIAYVLNWPILIFRFFVIHRIPYVWRIRPFKRGRYKTEEENKTLKKENAELSDAARDSLESSKNDILARLDNNLTIFQSPEYKSRLNSDKNIKSLKDLKSKIESQDVTTLDDLENWETELEKLTTKIKWKLGWRKNPEMVQAKAAAEVEINNGRIEVDIAGERVKLPATYKDIMEELKTAYNELESLKSTTVDPADIWDHTRAILEKQNAIIEISKKIGIPISDWDQHHVKKLLQNMWEALNNGTLPLLHDHPTIADTTNPNDLGIFDFDDTWSTELSTTWVDPLDSSTATDDSSSMSWTDTLTGIDTSIDNSVSSTNETTPSWIPVADDVIDWSADLSEAERYHDLYDRAASTARLNGLNSIDEIYSNRWERLISWDDIDLDTLETSLEDKIGTEILDSATINNYTNKLDTALENWVLEIKNWVYELVDWKTLDDFDKHPTLQSYIWKAIASPESVRKANRISEQRKNNPIIAVDTDIDLDATLEIETYVPDSASNTSSNPTDNSSTSIDYWTIENPINDTFNTNNPELNTTPKISPEVKEEANTVIERLQKQLSYSGKTLDISWLLKNIDDLLEAWNIDDFSDKLLSKYGQGETNILSKTEMKKLETRNQVIEYFNERWVHANTRQKFFDMIAWESSMEDIEREFRDRKWLAEMDKNLIKAL